MKKGYIVKTLIGALTVLSLCTVCPQEASAEWKQDSKGWWYSNGNSYYTGWKLIDNNWYYFYSDGYMATNDKIGNYFVNSTGAWTNAITADEAYQLILNEDGNFITEAYSCGSRFANNYQEYSAQNMPYTGNAWNIPRESIYEFSLQDVDNNGEVLNDFCDYLVGKDSKNVYVIPNQGNMDVYQIQDNKKVKTIQCTGGGQSSRWH